MYDIAWSVLNVEYIYFRHVNIFLNLIIQYVLTIQSETSSGTWTLHWGKLRNIRTKHIMLMNTSSFVDVFDQEVSERSLEVATKVIHTLLLSISYCRSKYFVSRKMKYFSSRLFVS